MINNIENQVETAAVYVTKGKDNIKKAVVYDRRNRKVCYHDNHEYIIRVDVQCRYSRNGLRDCPITLYTVSAPAQLILGINWKHSF